MLSSVFYINSQVAAYECGLAGIVHSIWAWCQMDSSLMDTTLALLSTFTAKCTQGENFNLFYPEYDLCYISCFVVMVNEY